MPLRTRRASRKMTEHVTVTMPPDLLKALRAEAERRGATVAELSRKFLQAGLDTAGVGNG
jgi:CopG-like RHH_1 or ribbon-helix-helix domain, RHH_5